MLEDYGVLCWLRTETRRCHFVKSDELVNLYIYLFINFAKRPGSLTEQAPLLGPEKKKRKLMIQLTGITIL